MTPGSLTGVQIRIALRRNEGIPAMRWLVVLIATFIVLAALTELRYRDFPPRPTRPMPAVNVP